MGHTSKNTNWNLTVPQKTRWRLMKMDTDKFLADLLHNHQKSLEVTPSWDVQYFSRSAGGWVAFKEFKNEEEAFWKAEVLAEGLQVRIIEFDGEDSEEVWKS